MTGSVPAGGAAVEPVHKQQSRELASRWEKRTEPPAAGHTRRTTGADGAPGRRWEVRTRPESENVKIAPALESSCVADSAAFQLTVGCAFARNRQFIGHCEACILSASCATFIESK